MTKTATTMPTYRWTAPSGDATDCPITVGADAYALYKAYHAPSMDTHARDENDKLYITPNADAEISAAADYSSACAVRIDKLGELCKDELKEFDFALEMLGSYMRLSSCGFQFANKCRTDGVIMGNLEESITALKSVRSSIDSLLGEVEYYINDITSTLHSIADYELAETAHAVAALLEEESATE